MNNTFYVVISSLYNSCYNSEFHRNPRSLQQVVKELTKQPNGSFVASVTPAEDAPSPRTKRSNKTKDTKMSLEVPTDAQVRL